MDRNSLGAGDSLPIRGPRRGLWVVRDYKENPGRSMRMYDEDPALPANIAPA
jgi:hypothetical protein